VLDGVLCTARLPPGAQHVKAHTFKNGGRI
jgi:hypothetical protein